MPQGPFGGPRPLSKEQLVLILEESGLSSRFGITGPLGGPRPLAKQNPVSEREVEECARGESAEEYISGLEERMGVEIPPERRFEMKKDWCRGILSFYGSSPDEPANE